MQKKCMELIKSYGEPGFIVFGWKKEGTEFGVTYATHKMPPPVVVKGMLWAAHDYANQHI